MTSGRRPSRHRSKGPPVFSASPACHKGTHVRQASRAEFWRRTGDRFPDGRYPVAGVAKRFGVSPAVVHVWIKRGLVTGERNDFQAHRRVWWLEIPETIAARLEQLALTLKRV